MDSRILIDHQGWSDTFLSINIMHVYSFIKDNLRLSDNVQALACLTAKRAVYDHR